MDPESKAALWIGCGSAHCKGRQGAAVVVTDDNFTSEHYVKLKPGQYTDLVPVQGGFFVFGPSSQPMILTSTGVTHTVRTVSQRGPLRDGEVLVTETGATSLQHYALSPGNRTIHPLALPPHRWKVLELHQEQGRTLTALVTTRHSRPALWKVTVSGDGGRTWSEPWRPRHLGMIGVIPTGRQQTVGIVAVGDDAVQAPQFSRSTDGGGHWSTYRPAAIQRAVLAWSVIRPDGSLLVYAEGWAGPGGPTSSENVAHVGLYASDGADWSRFHRVDSNIPKPQYVKGLAELRTNLLLAQTDSTGTQHLYVSTFRGLYVSTDGGRTWQHTRAR